MQIANLLINRFSCFTICHNSEKITLILIVCIVIERIEHIGNLAVQHIGAEKITRFQQTFQTAVTFVIQIVHIDFKSPVTLAGQIAAGMAAAGRNTVNIRKHQVIIHKIIEDTGCENTAHTAALQNQTAIVQNEASINVYIFQVKL